MGAREAASAPNAYRIARMCRLFGFRSNIPARVHEDLVCEKNSLRAQSVEHKDGWGIASYVDGALPEVAHGVGPAHLDPEFERVSSLLSSHAVVAHVRLASVGPVGLQTARLAAKITEVGATKPSSTNFIVTDGRQLLALRRHRTLFYSERLSREECPEPPPCQGRKMRQFIVASEILDPDTHWYEVPEDCVVGVTADLTFRQWTVAELVKDE